jgi:tetratricopeptide (TPR) repeat protein
MSITIKDGPSEGTRGIDPEAKLREARSEQRAGNYQSASDKYRAALNVLGERASGETWQQLGICLQRLNNTSGAAEAYQKAIRSFERDLAEGRNAESARIGLETAKQALQSLGSG